MKFTCPHCSKPYDVQQAIPGQQAKCKKCGNYFFIPNPGDHTEISTPSSSPIPPKDPSSEPLLHYCPCGSTLRIQTDQVNDFLRCPCGRQIVVPGSRLFYLRSLRRLGLFFMWIAVISLIIAFFQALSSPYNY